MRNTKAFKGLWKEQAAICVCVCGVLGKYCKTRIVPGHQIFRFE